MSTRPEPISGALEGALARFGAAVRAVGRRYRLSDGDVDELTQEVRIRLWRAHEAAPDASEQIEGAPASYVYRTAVTAALDLFRRRRARREDRMAPLEDAEGAAVASPGPESDAGARELATQVDRAIETVPASRRPVLRMYLAGYSKDEIAELMGWSEAKVRNLLYRGLADLRDRLAALGIAERA